MLLSLASNPSSLSQLAQRAIFLQISCSSTILVLFFLHLCYLILLTTNLEPSTQQHSPLLHTDILRSRFFLYVSVVFSFLNYLVFFSLLTNRLSHSITITIFIDIIIFFFFRRRKRFKVSAVNADLYQSIHIISTLRTFGMFVFIVLLKTFQ